MEEENIKEHQRRLHKLEGREAKEKSDFLAETIIKFTIDTIKVYRDLIVKIKDKKLSPEDAIKYLNKVEEILNETNNKKRNSRI